MKVTEVAVGDWLLPLRDEKCLPGKRPVRAEGYMRLGWKRPMLYVTCALGHPHYLFPSYCTGDELTGFRCVKPKGRKGGVAVAERQPD